MEPESSKEFKEIREKFTQNHSYLGFNKGESVKISIEESNTQVIPNIVIVLPLCTLSSTVLFPNDTIPLKDAGDGRYSGLGFPFLAAIGVYEPEEEIELSEEDEELGDIFAFQRSLLLRLLSITSYDDENAECLILREELAQVEPHVNDTIFFYLSEEERNDIDQFQFSLNQPTQVQPLHQELFQLYKKANNYIQLILQSQVNGYENLRQLMRIHKECIILRKKIRHILLELNNMNMSIESQNSSGNSDNPNPIEQLQEESETGNPTLQQRGPLLADISLNINSSDDNNKNKYNGIFVVSHRIDNRRNTNNGENNINDSAYYSSETNIANFGVIVQIKKGNINQFEKSFSLICVAKQRVKIISTQNRDGVDYAQVFVLGECEKLIQSTTYFNNFNWPKWIKNYDSFILLEQLKAKSVGILDIESIPSDPEIASYWVAKNLILTNEQRLRLLALPLSVRLLELIDILKSYSSICCRNCGTLIAEKESIFSISTGGPQNAFVNAYGYVHDTITLTSLSIQPRLVGRPEAKDCWFYGYAWIIAVCPECYKHLGWKYVRRLPNIEPESFWGLSRPTVSIEKR